MRDGVDDREFSAACAEDSGGAWAGAGAPGPGGARLAAGRAYLGRLRAYNPDRTQQPDRSDPDQREPTSMPTATETLDRLAIDTIRTLSIDGVQQANSGHPGAPMGAAPMAYTLWTRFLRHAPTHPDWPDRDRFVLSAGHASMLLYSLLHLTGYDVSLDDLKAFRQWGSKTPGHPEYGLTPGVEATTGPLGQGFANAVGMAIAEARLAAEFNRDGHDIVDHWTYTLCSDGDLQEGIASEAASLAGHLRLRKLVALYDDNHVQLDGPTSMAWSEDVVARFEAYGWHATRVEDGNDIEAIAAAIEEARADDRPSLIAVRTHIGFGSPNRQDTQKAHGAPLGPDEVRLVKEAYGWDPDKTFFEPPEAIELFRRAIPAGNDLVEAWQNAFEAYADAHADVAAAFRRRVIDGRLPDGWDAGLPSYAKAVEVATRNASQDVIQALAKPLPRLFGGAADLSESNLTDVKGEGSFEADSPGRNVRFGVREHAMGGIANGIAYHGGFIPYAATFLTFSDYMRGSVRLAALSGLQVIYVWTHDSVGLGEDGPTHQPVEHYAALRAIPNLWFVRPGDANETAAAWALAVERGQEDPSGPVALSLTRQKLPTLAGTDEKAREGVRRGGYVLRDAAGDKAPQIILIGTGSELQLAFGAAEALEADGIAARVVSLPCWERFELQDAAYRESVLPRSIRARVAVEAGVSLGWDRWVGDEGAIIGLDHFGASAPAGTIFETFGFTVDRVVAVARDVLAGKVRGPRPTLEPGHLPAPRRGHAGSASHTGGGDGHHPTLARAKPASVGPRRPIPDTAEPAGDARRLLGRSRRRRPQGRAAPAARGRGPRPRADRPRRRWLRPPGRLPGLRGATRVRGPRRRGGPRRPDLRLGCRRERRRQQDPRRPDCGLPRHLFRPPGCRARRHERPDPRLAGDRSGARLGVRRRLPRRATSAARRATTPPRQGARDRGRRAAG